MKGIFICGQLELELHVDGEEWLQGTRVKGQLKVRNREDQKKTITSFKVELAQGNKKKIKEKSISAFSMLEKVSFSDTSVVESQDENILPFFFDLESNCPVTEKSAGLYLLCGEGENPYLGGMLELNITPHQVIKNYFHVLENLFRFKVKSYKTKKGALEATVTVPNGKDFSSVQSLKMLLKMNDKNLEIQFLTKVKKMSFDGGVMSTKDSIVDIEQVLTPEDYYIYGESINQEGISKFIESYLEQVKLKPLI